MKYLRLQHSHIFLVWRLSKPSWFWVFFPSANGVYMQEPLCMYCEQICYVGTSVSSVRAYVRVSVCVRENQSATHYGHTWPALYRRCLVRIHIWPRHANVHTYILSTRMRMNVIKSCIRRASQRRSCSTVTHESKAFCMQTLIITHIHPALHIHVSEERRTLRLQAVCQINWSNVCTPGTLLCEHIETLKNGKRIAPSVFFPSESSSRQTQVYGAADCEITLK